MEESKKNLTPSQARPKIEYYCSYQERCHQEVTDKLYSFGLNTDDVNLLLSELVRSGFLNEQRFAILFMQGKFRQKKWGRVKIRSELKSKRISDICIKKAFEEIDDDIYLKTLLELADKYKRTLKDKSPRTREQKILRHLLSKGYEYDLCRESLNEIR